MRARLRRTSGLSNSSVPIVAYGDVKYLQEGRGARDQEMGAYAKLDHESAQERKDLVGLMSVRLRAMRESNMDECANDEAVLE